MGYTGAELSWTLKTTRQSIARSKPSAAGGTRPTGSTRSRWTQRKGRPVGRRDCGRSYHGVLFRSYGESRLMALKRDIVITGVGVVSPIGIGKEAFWTLAVSRGAAACGGWPCSASPSAPATCPRPSAARWRTSTPKQYVRPRKSLKVMSRDIQLGFAAADMACAEAGLRRRRGRSRAVGRRLRRRHDPVRSGRAGPAPTGSCMVDGQFDFSRWGEQALAETVPAVDAEVPAEHAGLPYRHRPGRPRAEQLDHAGRRFEPGGGGRGRPGDRRRQADVMIAGGTSSRLHPTVWSRNQVFGTVARRRRSGRASAAVRRRARRHGQRRRGRRRSSWKRRQRAEARGATVAGAHPRLCGQRFEPRRKGRAAAGRRHPPGHRRRPAQRRTHGRRHRPRQRPRHEHDRGRPPRGPGHPRARWATCRSPRRRATSATWAPAAAPWRWPSASWRLQRATVPPTRNYACSDPMCPVNVIRDRPLKTDKPAALVLNHTSFGQTIAFVLGAP